MPKGWKTISIQVREEEYKKAKELGINISEVLKKALREEIKRKEEEKIGSNKKVRRVTGKNRCNSRRKYKNNKRN